MTSDESTELNPRERAEFEALPRERMPGRLLEERTVRSLRARGLLKRHSWTGVRVPWLAAGLAASLALFASGVAVGQWLGSSTVANSLATAQQETAMQAAAAVQRAGSAYVTALMAFAAISDSTGDGAYMQGREAALNALYAAAYEMVQIDPTDPVAVTIREGLEQARLRWRQPSDTAIQRVVWF